MSGPPGPRRTAPRAVAAVALALALAAGLIPGSGAQDGSPAGGHAQIVAQGVAPLPGVPVGWRVVTGAARPAAEAPVAERSLGFLLPRQQAIVVTAEATGAQVRLAAGEAAFVPQGSRDRRASTDARPAPYHAIELVVAADLRADYSLGTAVLRYAGPTFDPPLGRRDLDLLRDVLAPGETTVLPAREAPALVLATAGAVRVEDATGGAVTLGPGEAGVVSGRTALTATGAQAATVVAALIGPEVPAPAAAPAPTTGTIAVTPHACPAGMSLASFDPTACPVAGDVAAIQVFVLGSGANLRTLDQATPAGGTWTWTDLPFGEYLLQVTALGPGYARYYVPGLDNLNAGEDVAAALGPNGGYVVPLSAAAPAHDLDLYALAAPAAAEAATVGLFVAVCPAGVVAADDLVGLCQAADPIALGFDLAITGDALAAPRSLADASPGDAGAYVWDGLPLGTYRVTVTSLPSGYDGYALRPFIPEFQVTLLPDRTGYTFTLTEDLFDPASDIRRVNIEAYLLVS